jgi:hypothetical protein
MIKKLRNQPYAPKVGASSQMGAKRKKKNQKFILFFAEESIFSKQESGRYWNHRLKE